MKTLFLGPEDLQKCQSKKRPPKPSLTTPEARILLKAVTSKLSQYGTTIEQDKSTLQELSSSAATLSITQRRRKMAIEVRVGEKEILQQVSSMLQDLLTAEEENGKRTAEYGSRRHQKKAKLGRH